jgi:hypothetical protein
MPYIDNGLPVVPSGALPGHIHLQSLNLSSVIAAMSNHDRPSHKPEPRRRSSAKSASSRSSNPTTTSAPLRLADVAKQHCMGIHTEAWREDIAPVRQYLPMQHIIGSLKRDRDDGTDFARPDQSSRHRAARHSMSADIAAASPISDDSFLGMLRTPKRRRTFDSSCTDATMTPDFDSDWHSGDQNYDHIPKEIPRSALPGLNHMINLSTLTPSERDAFSEFAPPDLEDPHFLMNEVLHLREDMMSEYRDDESPGDLDDTSSTIDTFSPIVPPEREIEVRRAFEEFIDYNDTKRYIAKI